MLFEQLAFVKVMPTAVPGVTHIILPHMLFGRIFQQYRGSFDVHLRGPADGLVHFWSRFLVTPYGELLRNSCPALVGKTARDLDKCIPLVLHGDAVPYSHRRSAMVVQWGSLTGSIVYLTQFAQPPSFPSPPFPFRFVERQLRTITDSRQWARPAHSLLCIYLREGHM